MASSDIGIDLGTASILVYVKDKGVVLKEPSVVAYDRDTEQIKAIGEEARLMLGRTPGNIVAVRPLRQGVISDYRVTEKDVEIFHSEGSGQELLRKTPEDQRLRAVRSYRCREAGSRGCNISGGCQRCVYHRRTGGCSDRCRY